LIKNGAVTTTNGTAYTFSFFVKSAGRRYAQLAFGTTSFGSTAFANFDLQDGVVGTIGAAATATITPAPGGYYRCALTSTASSAASNAAFLAAITSAAAARAESYTGDGVSGLNVWGAQLETGSVATSYIPTTTAAASRGADQASIAGLGVSGAHSVIALKGATTSVADATVYGLHGAVTDSLNRTLIYHASQWIAYADSAGANTLNAAMGSAATSPQKLAARFDTNSCRGAVGGTLGALDSSGALPVGPLILLRLGARDTAFNGPLKGNLELFAILPRALTDAELQAVSA
jgi:hypothetical protein